MESLKTSRRSLLRFLLSSPLAFTSTSVSSLQVLLANLAESHDITSPERALITKVEHAVDVFDFEALAKERLLPAHWTYLSMGVQQEVTLRANRSAFDDFILRPRRLVDTRNLDTRLELFGQALTSPILLCPCGSQRAYHADGELAVARAARSRDHLMILSMGSSTPLEEVVEARGAPVWFQLYSPRLIPFSKYMIRRAERAGCPVLVLTVDQVGMGANRDRLRRYRRRENAECVGCHDPFSENVLHSFRSGLESLGFDPSDAFSDHMTLDWDYVDRVRDTTGMKLVIKGLLTAEDAALCVEHGVDGLVVSNHGGRAEDSGLAAIDALPGIAKEVDGRIPILIDSGFRRGTDFFKALALGATAVGIGRPYLWGLASFGQAGVEGVLDVLDREFREIMVEMGVESLAAMQPGFVRLPQRLESPISEAKGSEPDSRS